MSNAGAAPSDVEAIAEALARTRKSYDDTPYASVPIQRQHPGRLAAAARWRHLSSPPADAARVLEIGCASGGHIIPLAAALPRSRFVGVDLSSVQIAHGQARIDRLGLSNISLSARSLSEIEAADGTFDYIVCHGVYSWVPESVRRDLLRVVAERLAPDGVAAISFNVLPGWRLFQLARDSLLLHARLQNDPAERAAQARDLFARLAEQSRDRSSFGRFWRDEARRLAAAGDAYIAHEFFEDANSPVAFSDFCAALDGCGLAYLGESVVSANVEECIAPEGAQSIRELARGDDRAREQYIDIFCGRTFREALVVHAPRAANIRRDPPFDRLDEFHFIAARALRTKRLEGEDGAWLVADGDEGVVLRDASVVRAIERMIERQPRSSRLEDIAPAGAGETALRAGVADALVRLVQFGHCAISTLPVECATRLGERPVAWRLAMSDAPHSEMTANLRHAPIQLQPLQREFLPLLDGTRTRDDLVAHAVDLAERGVLVIDGPEGRLKGRDNFILRLGPATDDSLAGLLRFALLEGD